MDKYAVEIDKEVEKRAEKTFGPNVCPGCNSTLEQHGRVLWCPTCGTEPFEKKKD